MAPLNERQRDLVERHVKLAYMVSNRTAKEVPRLSRDERDAAALYGLCRAAGAYDPTCGIEFAAWAPQRIRGYILNDAADTHVIKVPYLPRLSAESQRKGELARNRGEAEGLRDSLVGGDSEPVTEAVREETTERVRDAVERLPRKERLAVQDELEGLSRVESARRRRVDETTLRRRLRSAHRTLQLSLNSELAHASR